MSRTTLGFFRATHAHTHQNPYSYTRVWIFIDTGQGLGITHRYQNLYGIETHISIMQYYLMVLGLTVMRWLYSMIPSYLICGLIFFSSSYLWSYWILSYLEALFYSWRTLSILSVFGLVDIIIRFKSGHMVNTCQTHVCHMLFTCTTVQCCVHSLFYCITHSFSFHLLSLSFNLHSLFLLLTNHAFHLLISVIPAYSLLG